MLAFSSTLYICIRSYHILNNIVVLPQEEGVTLQLDTSLQFILEGQ